MTPTTLKGWQKLRDWARDQALEIQEFQDRLDELNLPADTYNKIDAELLDQFIREKALFKWIDKRIDKKYG